MWKSFLNNKKSPRKQILHNIDDITGYAAIRDKFYKYINGKLNIKYMHKIRNHTNLYNFFLMSVCN